MTEQLSMQFTDKLDAEIDLQKGYVNVLEYQLDELETQCNELGNRIDDVLVKRQIALQELSRLKGIKANT